MANYDLLDSVTFGASTSVTFSSIDQSYRDLILVAEGEGAGSGAFIVIRYNSDTGSNYNRVRMYGTGSTTSSQAVANQAGIYGAVFENGNVSSFSHQILDYSATDKHKPSLMRANRTGTSVEAQASRWANTSAITSVTIEVYSGTPTSNSNVYLYGVAA